MFFCIPLGCHTSIKPDSNQEGRARLCPRCHNAAVFSAKRTEWFELFFIPIIPISSKHVWLCSICQFSAVLAPGQWEPPIAGQPGSH
ncbi:hypothetical protein C8J56DRAFT_955275 [Mycena floridula]|nr:hypothetical protein C8J56DRAFT_955275 [Mycena floridula]